MKTRAPPVGSLQSCCCLWSKSSQGTPQCCGYSLHTGTAARNPRNPRNLPLKSIGKHSIQAGCLTAMSIHWIVESKAICRAAPELFRLFALRLSSARSAVVCSYEAEQAACHRGIIWNHATFLFYPTEIWTEWVKCTSGARILVARTWWVYDRSWVQSAFFLAKVLRD
jgi:hypothetical protein